MALLRNKIRFFSLYNTFLFFRLSESCSHIGAVLFKVEAAVKLGYTKTACTEEPCKWNEDFVKTVVPAKINAIKFYNTSKSKIT
jgi:hypothetical protein